MTHINLSIDRVTCERAYNPKDYMRASTIDYVSICHSVIPVMITLIAGVACSTAMAWAWAMDREYDSECSVGHAKGYSVPS